MFVENLRSAYRNLHAAPVHSHGHSVVELNQEPCHVPLVKPSLSLAYTDPDRLVLVTQRAHTLPRRTIGRLCTDTVSSMAKRNQSFESIAIGEHQPDGFRPARRRLGLRWSRRSFDTSELTTTRAVVSPQRGEARRAGRGHHQRLFVAAALLR
jgi:hypothetical protein